MIKATFDAQNYYMGMCFEIMNAQSFCFIMVPDRACMLVEMNLCQEHPSYLLHKSANQATLSGRNCTAEV